MDKINNISLSNIANTQKLNNTNNGLFFSSKNDELDLKETKKPPEEKEERKFGQKFGTGLSSFLFPGLGQLSKGENKKAAIMFGSLFLAAPIYFLNPIIGTAAFLAIQLYSGYDAYKN